MHYTHLEAIQVVQKLSYLLRKDDYEKTDVVLCPSLTSLRTIQTTLEADKIPIELGAQNVFWEDDGAYTGEVSAQMLAKLNVHYVIIGHSERRQIFGETDEMVNKKLKAVHKHVMIPIVCCGETLDEREAGETTSRLDGQIRGAYAGIKGDAALETVVAYEPIWAIGTGRNATAEDAGTTIGGIRATLTELYGETVAEQIRIQYGGSVKPGNIDELMARPEIDGALVGGASLVPEDFARIICFES